MLEIRVDIKDSFGLIRSGGKYFNPVNGLFSRDLLFRAIDCEVFIRLKDNKANAKSSMSIASLGIRDGDEIWFEIVGENEYGAMAAVLELCRKYNVI